MPRPAHKIVDRHEVEIATAIQEAMPESIVVRMDGGDVILAVIRDGFTLRVGVQQRGGVKGSIWTGLDYTTEEDARPRTLQEYERHAKKALELVALGRKGETAACEVLRRIYGPHARIG